MERRKTCEPREGVPAELSSSRTRASAEEPWWERGRAAERSLSGVFIALYNARIAMVPRHLHQTPAQLLETSRRKALYLSTAPGLAPRAKNVKGAIRVNSTRHRWEGWG